MGEFIYYLNLFTDIVGLIWWVVGAMLVMEGEKVDWTSSTSAFVVVYYLLFWPLIFVQKYYEKERS